ncbi:MAG: putative metallopeptidase [Candidatus Nanoarchaeia archaeon]|nr:putative metallopeptidase [Candidatus Nanoarchaeia archaeon]
MGIQYELAEDLQQQVNEIAELLFPHVKLDSVVCLRSHGSSSRGTIARCHALGKAMQLALGRKGFYVIEVISRRFDKMTEIEKTKTLIHELMHIPKTFGGGFIHHDVVHEKNVEIMFQKYINLKKKEGFVNSILNGEGSEKAREVSERVEMETLKKKWWF